MREVVDPNVSVVTNVSGAHLEGFGSLDNIMTEKVALAVGVDVALVGTRPPELLDRARAAARATVSVGLENADIVPESWRIEDGLPVIEFRGAVARLPLLGRHQAENAMFALALGERLGLDPGRVTEALSRVALPHGRTEVIAVGEATVVDDSYNANPESLRAALESLEAIRGDRRVVLVLGTMLELGPESPDIHRALWQEAIASGPDVVVAVGEFAEVAPEERFAGELILAPNADEAGALLAQAWNGDELVLLKGSRGVRLEKVLDHLRSGR
jgi:UDP-N-acetylmuramoyl-tripeptide--D-alanyl-D-alanine ligase